MNHTLRFFLFLGLHILLTSLAWSVVNGITDSFDMPFFQLFLAGAFYGFLIYGWVSGPIILVFWWIIYNANLGKKVSLPMQFIFKLVYILLGSLITSYVSNSETEYVALGVGINFVCGIITMITYQRIFKPHER